MRDPLRHPGGERQRRPAAHREPHQRHTVEPEPVQEAGEIANEMPGGVAGWIVGCVGEPMPALIKDNDAAAPAQRPHLVKPHALATREAVDQDDRQPAPEAAVVDVDVTDGEARHDLSVPLRPRER